MTESSRILVPTYLKNPGVIYEVGLVLSIDILLICFTPQISRTDRYGTLVDSIIFKPGRTTVSWILSFQLDIIMNTTVWCLTPDTWSSCLLIAWLWTLDHHVSFCLALDTWSHYAYLLLGSGHLIIMPTYCSGHYTHHAYLLLGSGHLITMPTYCLAPVWMLFL